ncbi:FAD-dependent monooxygenase [Saccharopolyspora gregorii]|uniref:FAD-binding domain-containing protein n=1 Tax=Saccharopolyspora gregorii TaxID=33914 RepID=A0ABP6RIR7_9PSEU
MDADVVVCGAGVGGLAAACALGARGFRVLLLEKMAEPSRVAKGEVLQPGALRVLREWGVAQRLESRGGLRLARLVARDTAGAPLMALDYDRLREQERWLLAHDYPVILEALADRLDGSVEFRRGVLVRDLLRDADGRVAGVRVAEGGQEREVRASLVVAADGISSRLRKSAGIPAHRDEYPHRLAAFDIADAPRVEQDFSAYVSERGLRLRYPLPGGRCGCTCRWVRTSCAGWIPTAWPAGSSTWCGTRRRWNRWRTRCGRARRTGRCCRCPGSWRRAWAFRAGAGR